MDEWVRVCTYGWVGEWADEWVGGRMDGWMDGWMDGRREGGMDGEREKENSPVNGNSASTVPDRQESRDLISRTNGENAAIQGYDKGSAPWYSFAPATRRNTLGRRNKQ